LFAAVRASANGSQRNSARLRFGRIRRIVQQAPHEFVIWFIEDAALLGDKIESYYMV
jgi:hypothetical protein